MSFFAELKRRNVVRVGIAYVLIAWVLLQAGDFGLDLIDAPNWMVQALVLLAILGLPVVLVFAWVYEMTPEGIKREEDIDRTQSVTPSTGRKLDRIIIIFLAVAVAFLLATQFKQEYTPDSEGEPLATQSPDQESSPGGADNPPLPSVAVLPFVNMSSDAEQEYFSDGISEEILNVLASITELKVAARTSSFVFKGSNLGIAEIANELGVNYVLEGSVRKAGNQVRVTAQLIKADDGFHIWSEAFDRELDNIFAIQDEIANNIADVLQVHLIGESHAYQTTKDLSPENYERYLKARYLMRRRNDDDMARAIEMNRQIVSEAPEFPEGLVQLAESIMHLSEEPDPETESLTNRALELNPNLAAGYALKGTVLEEQGRMLDSIHEFQKAISLDSADSRPRHWLGIALSASGFLEQGAAQLRKAVELEPDNANANGYLGFVLMLQGKLDQASHYYAEQDRLGNKQGAARQIHVELIRGDIPAARALLSSLTLDDSEERKRIEILCDVLQGRQDASKYWESDFQPRNSWVVSLEMLILGDFPQAFEKSPEVKQLMRTTWGVQWAQARALPQFKTSLEVEGVPEVWTEMGMPPMCRGTPESYDCGPINEN